MTFLTLGVAWFSDAGLRQDAAAEAGKRIPAILDTDIDDDIDDTWALTLLLKSPELDLKLVTTDDGRTVIDGRARKINCAMDWMNLPAFEDLLAKSLTGK